MVINLQYRPMAVVSKPGPLASPRFTKWYYARGLRSFIGAPRLMKDLFGFCLHLAKKYSEFLAKTIYFLVFSYIWQDLNAAKYKKCRGSTQCKCSPEKIIRPTPSLQF